MVKTIEKPPFCVKEKIITTYVTSVTNLYWKDCRLASGPMTGTGPLVAFETFRLVSIPLLGEDSGIPLRFSGSIKLRATGVFGDFIH